MYLPFYFKSGLLPPGASANGLLSSNNHGGQLPPGGNLPPGVSSLAPGGPLRTDTSVPPPQKNHLPPPNFQQQFNQQEQSNIAHLRLLQQLENNNQAFNQNNQAFTNQQQQVITESY